MIIEKIREWVSERQKDWAVRVGACRGSELFWPRNDARGSDSSRLRRDRITIPAARVPFDGVDKILGSWFAFSMHACMAL